MAGYPPQYPPPGPPYGGPSSKDWKFQRRMLRDQARAQRDQQRYQMRAMRRSSIVGPVIVVAIGIVFLLVQTGRLHEAWLWEWYGHWWPLLLVLAGVVLLIEWGIDQVRPEDPQRPRLRRNVGGGVITLVILLAIAGAISSGVHDGHEFFGHGLSINPDNIEEFLGDKHESDQSVDEAIGQGEMLTIENPHGDVSVSGTSTDDKFHLSLHKQVYSRSDSDADNKARALSPQVVRNGKQISITLPGQSGSVADLTLSVPAGTTMIVNANHGDVHLDSLKAPVTVTANHGDVELSAVGGAVTAHIHNNGSSFSAHSITGPVSVEGHGDDITLSDINGAVNLSGDFYGTTHLEHVTSPIRFHTSRTDFQLARLDGQLEISSDGISADQAVGPVVLTTGNRNVMLERVSGDLAVTNRNGSVDLTCAPPLGNVTVQNRNGSVNLTLPDHSNFVVNAETNNGDLQNDFSLPGQDSESRKTLNGTVGKGGPLIRINTSQGDVAIKKASIAPLPRVAPVAPTPPSPPSAPQVNIRGEDGSSVYVGKDGVRITSGSDGSSVIVGKEGLHITANADGSSVYKGRDGTQLTENADGSKVLIKRDGSRFTESPDGSKRYVGRDGTRISIEASGARTAVGRNGKSIDEDEIRDQLRQAQDDIRQAERDRDAERREHRLGGEH